MARKFNSAIYMETTIHKFLFALGFLFCPLFHALAHMTVLYSLTLYLVILYVGFVIATIISMVSVWTRALLCYLTWFLLIATPVLLNFFCRSEEIYSEYAVIVKQEYNRGHRYSTLLFPNGKECTYLDKIMYDNFKKGYTVKVYLQKGCLGMPIVIDYENELTIYDKALGLLKTGPLLDAIERFNESWFLEKHPDARWQMGRLYERFGQILESSIDYWDQEAYKMYREAYSAGSKNAKKDMKRLEKKLRK